MTPGQRLFLARQRHGWSQEELALRAKTRSATISAIERDRSQGRRVIQQLAEALGVEPGWLLLGIDPPDWAVSKAADTIAEPSPAEPSPSLSPGAAVKPAPTWQLIGTVGAQGGFSELDGHLALRGRSSTVAVRVDDHQVLAPFRAPAILLLERRRRPRQNELALYWATENLVSLVRYHEQDDDGPGFVLVAAAGDAMVSVFGPGERPLRLYPVVGILDARLVGDNL